MTGVGLAALVIVGAAVAYSIAGRGHRPTGVADATRQPPRKPSQDVDSPKAATGTKQPRAAKRSSPKPPPVSAEPKAPSEAEGKHRMSDAELKALAAQYAGEWRFTMNQAVIKIDTDGTWYYKVTYKGKTNNQAEKNTWKLLEDGKILMTDEREATAGNMVVGKIKHENPAWLENGQLCIQEFSTVYRFTRMK